MKRHLIPVILTLCAVIPPAALLDAQQADAPAASETATPRAVIEEPIKDAGRVATGDKIAHDFVIKNAGDATLEITDVRPTCGCTVADFDHTIPPGGSGKIHVVLDTTTFGGPISKSVHVFTNDPENAKVELAIKAEVQPYLFVLPGFARFIQPQGSDPGVVESLVFTPSADNLEVTRVESPYPFLKADFRAATEDELDQRGKGRQWVVTLTLDYDQAPIGAIADYVKIYTNHPKQSMATIPVSGFVRPMIAVTPTEADFGQIDVAKDNRARMILRSFAPNGIQVTGAEADVPGVAVAVTPIEEGKRFAVEVNISPEMPKGAFAGTITIHTSHPKKPVVQVPLRGTVL